MERKNNTWLTMHDINNQYNYVYIFVHSKFTDNLELNKQQCF